MLTYENFVAVLLGVIERTDLNVAILRSCWILTRSAAV